MAWPRGVTSENESGSPLAPPRPPRPPAACLERRVELRALRDDAHALAAPAVSSLDRDRKAEPGGDGPDLGRAVERFEGPRHSFHPGLLGDAARRDLVAHGGDGIGGGAAPDQSGLA